MARDSWRGSAGDSRHGNHEFVGSGRPDASGAQGADPFAADDSVESSGPIDIMAVRRDDALIDAILSDGPVSTSDSGEYQLASLLAEWRSDILAEPLPERPDLDEIAAAVDLALAEDSLHRQRTRSRMRLLRPLVGAAAAVAFLAGGITAVSYGAEPGDPLWKVKEVVFTEQADSTVAQVDTTTALEDATDAIARGDAKVAKTRLDQAAARTEGIRDQDERQQLRDWWNRLSDDLARLTAPPVVPPPTAPVPSPVDTTVPSVPLDVLPELPAQPQFPIPSEIQLPTEIPLPSDIPLPFPLPTDLPFIPQPPTTVPIPSEILRAPSPSPAPVTTSTAAAPAATKSTVNGSTTDN
ncbi:MAG: anti-sigma-D factor RsdA [Rhodococcus sp. (in: high G+C Gram-positive bacteria)]